MRGLIHQKGGNSTYGNNRRFYWHNAKERGFYGNQHVKTVGLKTVGNGITKVSGSVGSLIDGYKIFTGYILDGHQMGYYTIRATADIAGGWAGAACGARIGASIGMCFGGVGVIPGSIIGGAIGGFAGAYCGSWAGTTYVDILYGM